MVVFNGYFIRITEIRGRLFRSAARMVAASGRQSDGDEVQRSLILNKIALQRSKEMRFRTIE